MDTTLTHPAAGFWRALLCALERNSTPTAAEPAPPIGYRWTYRRWRALPQGGRDYAALHDESAFRTLLPVSSRLASPRR